MGCRGGMQSEIVPTTTTNTIYYYKLPITFNYRKYIYGCIADNTVALISHCCISATNTHNTNECDVLINRIFLTLSN